MSMNLDELSDTELVDYAEEMLGLITPGPWQLELLGDSLQVYAPNPWDATDEPLSITASDGTFFSPEDAGFVSEAPSLSGN